MCLSFFNSKKVFVVVVSWTAFDASEIASFPVFLWFPYTEH